MCIFLKLLFFFILLFSISASEDSYATNNDIKAQITGNFETNNRIFMEEFSDENLNSSTKDCDCGIYSTGCKLINGIKVCSCQPGFAVGQNMICVDNCNETLKCENGGSCLQHVCICLPGTRGPYCKTVDDCEDYKLCGKDENTRCEYSVEKQRAECSCRIYEYRFDDASKTCKNCICSPGWSSDFKYFSNCEYHEGNKICTCNKGYAYNPVKQHCEDCLFDKHYRWCKFNENGRRVYACEEGYSSSDGNGCVECKCGKHGQCAYSSNWYNSKWCRCDEGYVEYHQTCLECACGKYGKCIFDKNLTLTGCECIAGYAEKLGRCEMCYCGDNANCSFNGNFKQCDCVEGYHDVNGFCEDIDECEKHNPCKSSSICINTPGSYKCLCAEGYEIKRITLEDGTEKKTCADIDECKNPNTCTKPDSECLNTVGSFSCICKSGFVSRGGIGSDNFCEKTSDGSLYTVATVTIFSVLLVLLGFYIFTKRSSRNAASSGHELNSR